MGITLYANNQRISAPPWPTPARHMQSRATQTDMRFFGDDFVMVSQPTPPSSRRPSNETSDGSSFGRTMAWLTSFFQ